MKTSVALVGLCLLLATRAHAKPREVSFNCGALWSQGPLAPVRALDTLIVQNPRVRRFRIRWDTDSSMGTSGGEGFYNRDAQTVLVESYSDTVLKDEEGPLRETKQMKRWLVSGVTRARLHQLIRAYQNKPNEEGNDASYLPQLKRFGCSVRVVADFNHTDLVPEPKAKK